MEKSEPWKLLSEENKASLLDHIPIYIYYIYIYIYVVRVYVL